MVVLSEKDLGLVPPPPYFAIEHGGDLQLSKASSSTLSPSPSCSHLPQSSSSSSRPAPQRAPALPSHILLLIVYSTLPQAGEFRLDRVTGLRVRESAEDRAVRTTRTMYWMAFCLRAVNRGFYLTAMHILRSTFLPHYVQRVRSPYSSDPFPHTSLSSHQSGGAGGQQSAFRSGSRAPSSVVSSIQSESEILDRYILHQLHEDVFVNDSSLHISRPETLRDLFDFMQPRARLTDLVRAYGTGAGLIALSTSDIDEEEDVCNANGRTRAELEEWELVHAGSSSRRPSSSTNGSHGLYLRSQLSQQASTSTLTLVHAPHSSRSFNTHPPPSASQSKLYTYSYIDPDSERSNHWQHRATPAPRRKKILHTALRIAFSPRRIGLVYTTNLNGSGPRTIVDLPRPREEPLERSASRLVAGLKTWVDSSSATVY